MNRQSSHRRVCRISAALMAMAASTSWVQAITYDSNGGNWAVPGTWTPGGIPGVGDNVIIDATVTVSDPRSYGDAANGSLWTGGNITINAGQTLTQVAGSTTSHTNTGTVQLNGGGIFINQGTLIGNNPTGDGPDVQANTRLRNASGGLIDLQDDDGWHTNAATAVIENQAGGTILKSGGAGTATFAGSGQFINAGNVTSNSGKLLFNASGGNISTGGTWTAGAGAEINVGGNWNELTAVTAGAGKVAISTGFTANVAGNTNINVTGNGLEWIAGNINIAAGRTMTNLGTIVHTVTSNVQLTGGGVLINEGTWIENNLTGDGPDIQANTTFRNASGGLFELKDDDGWNMNAATSVFENQAGGTMLKSGGAGTANFNGGGVFLNAGDVTSNSGKLLFSSTGGNVSTGGTWTAGAGAEINLGGNWNELTAVTAGAGKVAISTGFTANVAGNTNINVTGNGLEWIGGNINIAAGRTLTNLGTIAHTVTGNVQLTGGGILINEGTWIENNATGDGPDIQANTTFRNASGGLFDLQGDDGWFLNGATAAFENQAGATMLRSGTGTANFSGTGTFINAGDITVNSGILQISATGGNVSTGGTWTTINAGNEIRVLGAWNQITATTAGLGKTVVEGGTLSFVGIAPTINVTGNGLHWRGGVIDLNGQTVENLGIIRFEGSGTDLTSGPAGQPGVLKNSGTIFHTNNNFIDPIDDVTIQNASGGIFDFQADGKIHLQTANTFFINEAGATIRKSGGAGKAIIQGAATGTLNLLAGSSLEATSGELEIVAPVIQVNGVAPTSTLLYNVKIHNATIDIRSTPAQTTVGSGATLDLAGTANFLNNATNLIQNQLHTVNGTLLVSSGFSLTPAGGALTVNGLIGGNGGTIIGSVSGTGDIAPGLSAGQITITNGLTLAGGSYLWELGALDDNATGTAGVDWDLIITPGGLVDLTGLTLDLDFLVADPDSANLFWDIAHDWTILDANGNNNTLFAGITNNSFARGTFTQSLINDGDVLLSFRPNALTSDIPEPASATFALLGAAGLMLRRRRLA